MSDFTWPKSDAKKYENEIYSILQSFEKAQEWADLSNCLQRLNRSISKEFCDTPGVPLKEIVSKRLAQCLNPSLPSGVHIKALETYGGIFEKIGRFELSSDLALYGSGLFPFFVHSSTQVKPIFLDLIDQYFLPLGPGLLPCLSGLLVGLLPGLEDSKSKCYDRIMRTFQSISSENCVGEKNFMCTLWLVILRTSHVRYPALEVIMARFSTIAISGQVGSHQKIQNLIPCNILFLKALESCVDDDNILVKRYLLDFLISHIPLSQESRNPEENYIEQILPYRSKINLLRKALKLFLLKEWPLTRRLLQWIMNDKYICSEHKNEDSIDMNTIQTLITAIIDELIFGILSLELYSTGSENNINFAKYQSIRTSKDLNNIQQSYNLTNQSTIIQPIKMVNAFFAECAQCIEYIMPKVLIPIFIYARESIIKVPELKDFIINECRSLLDLSHLTPSLFLDMINSSFIDLSNSNKTNVFQEKASIIVNPNASLLKEIILFYVDNFLLNQDGEDKDLLESFFIDLFIILIKIMVEIKTENIETIIFTGLCIFAINNLKDLAKKRQGNTIAQQSASILISFVEFSSSSLCENIFLKEDIALRDQLYEILFNLFEIEIFKEILLNQTEMVRLTPFEQFPIPSWLYKMYHRIIQPNFPEYVQANLENFHIEDLFKCLKIIIEILFNSDFFFKEFVPNCWIGPTSNIIDILWNFLNPDLFRFHETAVNLLIELEKWAQTNYNRISNYANTFDQPQVIRENSILNQLFINKLTTLDIDLRTKNIKKLSIFMKYSVNSMYKIPPEVTFLILEGLDSNSIQLKTSCSMWMIQAMETPRLVLDHLLNDLSGFEVILFMNNKLHYNEELDFARIIYSLERLIALISMEDIHIIQLLFDTSIDKSSIPNYSFQYDILNYFDAFVLICLALFTTEIPKSSDLRVECIAVNSLNFILNKSSNNSYNLSKRSFNLEIKLMNIIFYITNPILETLQESIKTKKYSLQAPIIQLLNTILLIQRKFRHSTDEFTTKNLISTNYKLFPIIICGIQQMPNTFSDEKIELNESDCLIFSTSFSSISSYTSLIKPYIDFSLSVLEDLDQEALTQNVKSIILCLSMELVVSLSNKNCPAIIQYLDSILKVLSNVIGIFPVSNVLSEPRDKYLQTNYGFIYSLFSTQKTYQSKSYNIELDSLTSLPKLLNYPSETAINSITKASKSIVLKNIALTLFGVLIEAINFVHENDLSKETPNIEMVCPQILHYVDSIAFIIAWNASDAFIFSGIVCWSHVNNHLINTKLTNTISHANISTGLRNTSIISIFQLNSIKELVNPVSIFSTIGDFLSYFWLCSGNSCVLNDIETNYCKENQESNIPSYLIFFSKMHLDKEWIHSYNLWKESLVYHFLYTVLVTSPFFNGPNDFLYLWEVVSALLNLFLQSPKQPKSILWFATIISTLDASMASSNKIPSSFFFDKKLLNIFEDKKLVKNLNNLIYMVLYLVHENFSSKVAGAVHPQEFDKFPPLPPSIEAILQSIEFDFSHDSHLSSKTSNIQPNNPKSVVSDDPSLLFSYYSMGFLIMYNTEVAFHINNKRLFLRNIWGSCIVKSLDWAFQPLIKRNNNVANMIHKYFLLLHIDTFPFRIFPDYLSGIKKPVIEALNSPNFFCMDRRTFRCWTNILSKLVSYDSTSLSAVGRANILEVYVSLQSMGIFSTRVAELQNRCNYIKRLAFLIFCCPQNTFQLQLSIILEKLVENLKLAPEYSIDSDSSINLHFIYLAEQVMLCLRVLLLKVHYQSLMPLWPIVLAELIKIFSSKSHQRLKISAMKFVDLASLLDIPEFHLYQWIFVTDFFNAKDSATAILDPKCKTFDENYLTRDNLFSPFCNISDSNNSVDRSMLGIDMENLDHYFKTDTLKFPLIKKRNKTESNEDFVEMALQLNKNCLLNSVKSSKIDNEKLLRSIENDFLDFPDNLLDWSFGCDLFYLYNMISNQKSNLKKNCSKFSNI